MVSHCAESHSYIQIFENFTRHPPRPASPPTDSFGICHMRYKHIFSLLSLSCLIHCMCVNYLLSSVFSSIMYCSVLQLRFFRTQGFCQLHPMVPLASKKLLLCAEDICCCCMLEKASPKQFVKSSKSKITRN